MTIRKPTLSPASPSEEDLLALASEALRSTILTLRVLTRQPAHQPGMNSHARVEIHWHDRSEQYECQIRRTSTPRALEAAIAQASFASRDSKLRSMVLAPYLSEEKLRRLADLGVSGLDACGNAFIISDQFYFWRSGQPNRYRIPSPHLNPFRGDNSIFSRCFLLRREFESLSELSKFASSLLEVPRGDNGRKALQLGTASKTIQALEEQLIVQKSRGMLKLLDRGKLLNLLKRNYQPPSGRKVLGKIRIDRSIAWERLGGSSDREGFRVAATGIYSATYFGVLSPSETLSIYVDDMGAAVNALEFTETKSFANCELIETSKNYPFFDLKREGGTTWASLIQTWLELSNGTAREYEAGQGLERMIVQGDWTR
jgi:hypothetical protein